MTIESGVSAAAVRPSLVVEQWLGLKPLGRNPADSALRESLRILADPSGPPELGVYGLRRGSGKLQLV